MPYRLHRVDPALLAFARDMRHKAVPGEQKVWWCLRHRRLGGFKFRRQFAIGSYIADFCCVQCGLIVELDGESHDQRQAYDERRSEHLRSLGFEVIRFSNVDVFESLEGVLLSILRVCEERTAGPSPRPSPPSTGERG